MKCPNKSSKEWKYLNSLVGEREAYRLFIAYDGIPDIATINKIIDPKVISTRLKEKEVDLTHENIKRNHNRLQKPDPEKDNHYILKDTGQSFNRLTDNKEGWLKDFLSFKYSDKSIAERESEKYWDKAGVDPSVKINIIGVGNVTKAEFIEKRNKILENGAIKGSIIHKLIEREFATGAEYDRITREIHDLEKEAGLWDAISLFSPIVDKLNIIFDMNNINALDSTVQKDMRDEVMSEIMAFSEALGMACTIDTLIKKHNGKYTIIEWKSGKNFDNNRLNNLLKYGDQFIAIYDNPRQRAKMQATMQAVILKSENPDIRFDDIFVHWIPSAEIAEYEDPLRRVEVSSYLRAIELQLKLEKPEVYKKLIEKSPNLFNPEHYSDVSSSLADRIIKSKTSANYEAESLLAEMERLNNSENITEEERVKYGKMAREATEILKESNFDINESAEEEISWFKKVLGNFGDIHNSFLQVYAHFYSRRKNAAEHEFQTVMRGFTEVLKDAKEEYMQKTGKNLLEKVTLGGINAIVYDEFYSFIWKKDFSGFITEDDPEFTHLTPAQKRVVIYVNTYIYKYLQMTMDKEVKENPLDKNNPYTLYDVYRKRSPGLEVKKGFAPKVPMNASEIMSKYSWRDKKRYKHMINFATGELVHDRYITDEHQYGLRVKYLGSYELEAADMFTKNVEFIFDKFMKNLIYKKHLDDVYHYGLGLQIYLQMKRPPNSTQSYFKNTVSFLEHHMESQLLNAKRKTKWSRAGIRPTRYVDIDIDNMINLLRNFTTMSVMWLKPVTGIANGIFTWMINHRKAAVTSLLKLDKNVNVNKLDYGEREFWEAQEEWGKMQRDAMMGNLRENKTFLLLRNFKFLPDNFDFQSRDSDLLTLQNPLTKQSSLFFFHTIFEEWNAAVVMIAEMKSIKLKDGTTAWDHYKVKDVAYDKSLGKEFEGKTYKNVVWDGTIRGAKKKNAIDDEYEVLTELTSLEIEGMKRVYAKMHGGYRKDERTMLEMYALGAAFLQYKKYLPSQLINLFGSRGKETYLGALELKKDAAKIIKDGQELDVYEWVARVSEGRAKVFMNFVLATLRIKNSGQSKEYLWENLSETDKEGLVDLMFTMSTYLAMVAVAGALFGWDEDEDPVKKTTARILDNYSQQYNFLDMLRTFKNPVAFISKTYLLSTSLAQVLASFGFDLIGNEKGSHTIKGDRRGWNNLQKQIPFFSSFYDIRKFMTGFGEYGYGDISPWDRTK